MSGSDKQEAVQAHLLNRIHSSRKHSGESWTDCVTHTLKTIALQSFLQQIMHVTNSCHLKVRVKKYFQVVVFFYKFSKSHWLHFSYQYLLAKAQENRCINFNKQIKLYISLAQMDKNEQSCSFCEFTNFPGNKEWSKGWKHH